jgi:AraC-like DNA-binding protein
MDSSPVRIFLKKLYLVPIQELGTVVKFIEHKPHNQLASYIDAYWDITCDEGVTSINKVLPDGCLDIIINIGDDFRNDYDGLVLKSGKAYLCGAITNYREAKTSHETRLAGIRFKPSAFSYFYAFSSLHEVTDNIVELSNKFTPTINTFSKDFPTAFDSFYHNKLTQPKRSLLPVIETITKCHGSISVYELATQHCTTVRQLERHFKYDIGLSPKEFINIIRYRFAQQLIQMDHPEKTLSDIAFECGYYDQAHLNREIKKYTGVVPTSL